MRIKERAFFKIKYTDYLKVIKVNNPFKEEVLKLVESQAKGKSIKKLGNAAIVIGTQGTRILKYKQGRSAKITHGLCTAGFEDEDNWTVELYESLYRGLLKYYKNQKKEYSSNPIFAIILERVAYITAKLKRADVYPTAFEAESFANIYNGYMRQLLNALEQLMKYTEVKTTKREIDSKEKIIHKHEGMSIDELEDRARELLEKRPGRITVDLGRVNKA